MSPAPVIDALHSRMPSVLRWAGAVAKQLRQHNVAVNGKESGNANTDALTLADLSLQELILSALRDVGEPVTSCRIEAEEDVGPLDAFATDSPLTIALDPIDGTKQFRDRTGDGYAVMLHLRDADSVHYSLTYLPEMGPQGHWLEVSGDQCRNGADDWSVSAEDALGKVTSEIPAATGKGIYFIGFQGLDEERAGLATAAGLHGHAPHQMPGSVYPLMASGDSIGSLIHTPNVYDFPVSLQISRQRGGDAVRVDTGEPVNFRDLWLDDKSGMLRLKGIVACAFDRKTLETLCDLGRDWNPVRYSEGM